ncbi:MAG: GHKL domain-containing protein [Deltaproteobacteria bacterium]|nr:GHKL domain-containing protein [Deltaproteobacteria bacterium]
MTFISLLSIIFVAIGAFFLAVSIYLNVRKNYDVPADLRGRWKIMTGLMVFFLAGYGGFLYLRIFHLHVSQELLTGMVFLGGAFFVLLVIQLSIETIRRINDAYALLEERVERRTAQLAVANKNLAAEIEERKKVEERIKAAHAELKAAQSQMLQKEKMASVGVLAAGMAHEINTPVGFVASNLSTLGKYLDRLIEFIGQQEKAMAGETAQEVRESRRRLKIDYIAKDAGDLIRESLEGVSRVSAIVLGLRNFSRVDEAQQQVADINECLEATLNILASELRNKAVIVREYGDIPRTLCYPRQLNQVFMNLLINACQAMEKEGEIRVRTWLENDMILVAISDTGCGISAGNLPRVFEPFFTTREVGGGAGLGLSISYEIIKKHGGDIQVESEPGKGATFTIKIPVA